MPGTILQPAVWNNIPPDSVGASVHLEGAGLPADTLAIGDPAAVFGPSSLPAVQTAGGAPWFDWMLTGNVGYSIAVLACLAGFCMLLHYFRPHVVTLANIFRSTLYIEKVMEEHNYIFETFRKILIGIGLLATGLLLVRYCDGLWGGRISEALPGWAGLLPVPAVWAGLAVVWFFQNILLRTAGWLTYSSKFVQSLISLRNLGYAMVFLFCLPLMFPLTLAGREAVPALSWIFFTVLGILLIFVILRTYMLFIRQKISILYWILYLCAVEILPVSFLAVLAVRGLQY